MSDLDLTKEQIVRIVCIVMNFDTSTNDYHEVQEFGWQLMRLADAIREDNNKALKDEVYPDR